MGAPKLKKDLKQLERIDGRAGADTIRLWDGYREQAFLWRALFLIQLPATTLAIATALVMYFFADTIIEVPEKPQPGFYSVKQLPDSQFINAAQSVVNLIATFQPHMARTQFRSARKYLWEPALTQFEETMMKTELRAIEETKRTQLYMINPRLIKLERYPRQDKVVVRIPGIRQKLIGGKPLPPDEMVYYVTMTTIPRNVHNEYGIVITDLRLDKASHKAMAKKDLVEERRARRRNKTGGRTR